MKNDNLSWFVAQASVRGKSHMDAGIPNQDAIHVVNHPDDDCLAIALSDGAGSARLAQAGATHFSRVVAQELHKLTRAVHEGEISGANANLISDQIIAIISDARYRLDPSLLRLKDFHCNLMAVAMGPRWGIRLHLGDAVLLKSSFQEVEKTHVDFFRNTQMTAQERTEYANETHFITQADWTKHLQWDFLDPEGEEDIYVLMTDGAADVALGYLPGTMERKVFRRFLAPLVANVLNAGKEGGGDRIAHALSSPQTYRLTGDDKTMAMLIRQRARKHAHLHPVMDEPISSPELTKTGDRTTARCKPEASAPPRVTQPEPETRQTKSGVAKAYRTDPSEANSSATKAVEAYANTARSIGRSKTSLLAKGIVAGFLLGVLVWPTYQWTEDWIVASAAPRTIETHPVSAHAPVVAPPRETGVAPEPPAETSAVPSSVTSTPIPPSTPTQFPPQVASQSIPNAPPESPLKVAPSAATPQVTAKKEASNGQP